MILFWRAICPAASLKYWSPWSFGRQHALLKRNLCEMCPKIWGTLAQMGRPWPLWISPYIPLSFGMLHITMYCNVSWYIMKKDYFFHWLYVIWIDPSWYIMINTDGYCNKSLSKWHREGSRCMFHDVSWSIGAYQLLSCCLWIEIVMIYHDISWKIMISQPGTERIQIYSSTFYVQSIVPAYHPQYC